MKAVIDGVEMELTVAEYIELKRLSTPVFTVTDQEVAAPAPLCDPTPPRRHRVRTNTYVSHDHRGQPELKKLNNGGANMSHIEVMRVLIEMKEPVTCVDIEDLINENIISQASVSPRLSALRKAGWVETTGSVSGFLTYTATERGVTFYNKWIQEHNVASK